MTQRKCKLCKKKKEIVCEGMCDVCLGYSIERDIMTATERMKEWIKENNNENLDRQTRK